MHTTHSPITGTISIALISPVRRSLRLYAKLRPFRDTGRSAQYTHAVSKPTRLNPTRPTSVGKHCPTFGAMRQTPLQHNEAHILYQR